MTLGTLRAVMEGDIVHGTVVKGQIAGLVSRSKAQRDH